MPTTALCKLLKPPQSGMLPYPIRCMWLCMMDACAACCRRNSIHRSCWNGTDATRKKENLGNQVWKSAAAAHGICDHARLLCTQLAEERADFLDMRLPRLRSCVRLPSQHLACKLIFALLMVSTAESFPLPPCWPTWHGQCWHGHSGRCRSRTCRADDASWCSRSWVSQNCPPKPPNTKHLPILGKGLTEDSSDLGHSSWKFLVFRSQSFVDLCYASPKKTLTMPPNTSWHLPTDALRNDA